MGKYFGTDGYRGKANIDLTAQKAFEVGRYLGYFYSRSSKRCILIGKDTRLSSDMLEHALAAGIASEGCDVALAGYCPTPAVAYLTRTQNFAAGAMISASHNPFHDNGIKLFSNQGSKVSHDIELEIEDYLDGKIQLEYKSDDQIGKIFRYDEGVEKYIQWMADDCGCDLKGFKIAVDCANGASCTTAEKLLTRLGAECKMIHTNPNGININTNCGSTHPEDMQDLMKQQTFDLGLTFDGDADRQILVAPDGSLMTGDHVLYVIGKYFKNLGKLNQNTVVTTVMANLGLFKAMEKCGISLVSTQVGDKYVYEEMFRNDFVVGGEQSGHVIFKHYATTGDGLLTALMFLKVMKETGKTALELVEGLNIYPQLLVNVKVSDKQAVLNDSDVLQSIAIVEKELSGNGRILVRPSGTEPLIRVMVEAETDEICHDMVYKVVDAVKEKYAV